VLHDLSHITKNNMKSATFITTYLKSRRMLQESYNLSSRGIYIQYTSKEIDYFRLESLQTHTHTHTHTYIYIYIYIPNVDSISVLCMSIACITEIQGNKRNENVFE
jgi:hypothetical protein